MKARYSRMWSNPKKAYFLSLCTKHQIPFKSNPEKTHIDYQKVTEEFRKFASLSCSAAQRQYQRLKKGK